MSDESQAGTLLTPRRIAGLVLLVLFGVFALLNTERISIQLLLLEVTGPMWLILFAAFLLGGGTAWLLLSRSRRR